MSTDACCHFVSRCASFFRSATMVNLRAILKQAQRYNVHKDKYRMKSENKFIYDFEY